MTASALHGAIVGPTSTFVDEPTCSCGHDRSHPKVEASPSYGAFGWTLLIFGATPIPRWVEYRCKKCGESLGISEDPEDIRHVT